MSSNGIPTPFMGSGVKQDLHLLYSKFSSIESNKIRDFAEVFRELRFETIFHYRISPAEYIEFSEYLLQNAALYFGTKNEIGEQRRFKERVFGIYTCYSLYNVQPSDHVCQIPVTNLQFEDLLQFEKILVSEKCWEPLAALKNLFLKKAFRLTVFQSSYDPLIHKKYISEEELPGFSRRPIEPFARAHHFKNHQFLGELDYIHKAYIQGKKNLGFDDIRMADKVNPVDSIRTSIEKHQKDSETTSDIPEETGTVSAGTSRSSLRNKAYSAELKHTRQRRHLDPNMEENFKHLTSGQSALLDEHDSQKPGTSQPVKHKKRRKIVDEDPQPLDDDAIAEQVLLNEYSSRVKPETIDLDEDVKLGGKIGRQGTSGLAQIRAPKRKNAKLVQVKTERVEDEGPTTKTPHSEVLIFDSPEKKKVAQFDVKPKIDSVWAHKLNTWKGQVNATDKKLKKLKSQIKIEDNDDDDD
uniref:snRNA-activating protein complex subunit 3 n=2 Tax=Caenorhabditis tropicalis TaxID=1561998 RepID=A0A1I7T4S2_9PELO